MTFTDFFLFHFNDLVIASYADAKTLCIVDDDNNSVIKFPESKSKVLFERFKVSF